MIKTLGGDRLGSGKKMKVELHGYERSTHDLSYVWRSSMAAGTLIPFMSMVALPGDSWDINLRKHVLTHPTVGPLFGSYKSQSDVFIVPIRLYNSWLHNNRLNIGLNMSQVKFPLLNMTAVETPEDTDDLDNFQINPSALLAYLGLRGIGMGVETGTVEREFNAIPMLAYWDIYKNYYANKQEEIGACIHTPAVVIIETVDDIEITPTGGSPTTLPEHPTVNSIPLTAGTKIEINFTGTQPLPEQIIVNTTNNGQRTLQELCGSFSLPSAGVLRGYYNQTRWGIDTAISWQYATANPLDGKPAIATFLLQNIDDMRDLILTTAGNVALDVTASSLEPYVWINQQIGTPPNGIPSARSSQELLALKTYQNDLLQNWLSTEWLDGAGGINEITAISTAGGSFEINTLILAKKVFEMLNRIAVSGGSYNDWLDTVWTEDRYRQIESPMYMGGLIKEVTFQEVISNSAAADGGQPLGTIAGRGAFNDKHKGGHIVIKVDEPAYIIGITSLTPRVDYSQGNSWDLGLKTMDDLHKPQLDQIGFQESINEMRAWWSTKWNGTEWIQTSVGKQPAWINYMTSVNKTFGNFAILNNEMFMTLNRRYEYDDTTDGIKDLTTYIDPSKFNYIFAETQLDAQNFWMQIGVDITCRRKMSAKIMPNL